MDADMKKTLDEATDAVQNAVGSVTDATKDTASDVMQIASDAADKASALVSDGVTNVRSAFDDNPVRTITIAALSVAGLIAIITAFARRAA
ncbi:hypothetical protein QL996_07225 [Planococcus sp. APC 4015]|nr:hypothetical protein [Planococcus sp. APC 4015]